MTPLWFVVLLALPLVSGAGTVAVMYLWREYGPSPSSAELANVPRRHLERRRAWQARCAVAYEIRDRANEAFIAAAQYRDTGPRSGEWYLAGSHPASIAWLAAQYPDGPPLPMLLKIRDSAAIMTEAALVLGRTEKGQP